MTLLRSATAIPPSERISSAASSAAVSAVATPWVATPGSFTSTWHPRAAEQAGVRPSQPATACRSRSPPCPRIAARSCVRSPSEIQTVFEHSHESLVRVQPMGSRRPTSTSSTKAQLLDVAEQLFLRRASASRSATSPTPPARTAPPSTTTSVPATASVGAVHRPASQRPRRPAPRRPPGACARRPCRRPSATSSPDSSAPTSGMVETEGPDAQRWVDLMHALWLDRSPALDVHE